MSYVSKNPRFNSQILTDQGTNSVDDPASGSHKVVNRNGLLYMRDSSGNETAIGSAGATGGINYIDNPNAETGTDGWATYADAAGTTPVDGTGGSANVTWTRTTTAGEILRGDASFELTVDAANRQGEGVSYDFTIDKADQNKVLGIWFDVDATDANFDDDDIQVFIYDKDQSQLITPTSPTNGYKVKGNQYRFRVAFAPYDTTSTNYRLILHVASTNASGYSLRFDNFEVGPGAVMTGFDGIWKTYDENDVTVTCAQAGYSLRYFYITPYKDSSGQWWAKGNAGFDVTGTTGNVNFEISDINTRGDELFGLAVDMNGVSVDKSFALTFNTTNILMQISAESAAGDRGLITFDFPIKEKPTWADFDPIATIYPTTDDLALGSLSTYSLSTSDFTNFTGLTLSTGAYANYKRVGSDLYVEIGWRITGTGTDSGEIALDLAGIVGQSITFTTGTYGAGVARRFGASVGDRDPDPASIVADGTGSVKFSVNTGQTNLTGTLIADSGTDRDIFISAAILPVNEWADGGQVPPIGLEIAANGAPGLISAYEEGTWTPSYSSDLNITGTGTFTGATYTRIGNKVFVEIDVITGYSQTSDATRTVLTIDHSGLPGIDNDTQYYGGGRAKASGDDVAITVVEASSTNDFISFLWKADGTGSLTLNAIHFWYNL